MTGEIALTEHEYEFDVFLSHHSCDKLLAEHLAARLADDAGLKPFLDKWHLIPGEPWQEGVEKAIMNSRCLAVLIGSNEMGPWHHQEMRAALEKRNLDPNFRVIPVILPGASPDTRNNLPLFIRGLTWVDFTEGLESIEGFSSLVAGINGTAPGRVPTFLVDGRTSWEHYDWLLQIDDYQIAYIPLINGNLEDSTRLQFGNVLLSAESLCFTLPKEFRSTRIQPLRNNDASCRLSSYQLVKENALKLCFSKTSYKDYLKSGEHLDDPHSDDSRVTLRDEFGGLIRDGERNLRPFQLTNICGIGLFIVTSDGFVIASKHSEKSHVYPGRMTFTASGTMKWSTLPDPFSQVVRKAWEEIRHQVVLDSLELTGFGVDARKLYFQFGFTEYHPAKCSEILSHVNSSTTLKPIALEPDAVVEAVLSDCWEPAAEAALFWLLSQRYGVDDVVFSLRKKRPRWIRRSMRDEWDYRASRPGVLPDMSVRYPSNKLNSASRRYVDRVINFLGDDLQKDTKLVEVGGGTGRITRKLVDRVGSLTVVDLSHRMIDRNKLRLGKKAGIVAEYLEGFAQECLNFRSFDVALASLVLVHNTKHGEFVSLIRSMCEVAPVVVICEDITMNRQTSPKTIIRTPEEIIDVFDQYGFRLNKQDIFNLFSDELWFARFSKVI
ncbi:MAG: TIR domain-containing protein [Candidatus Thiodiazotropha sp.]